MTEIGSMSVMSADVKPLPLLNRHWYGRSFGDPNARMFWSGKNLHVGLLPHYAELFESIPKNLMRDLTRQGYLPEFEMDPSKSEDFATVLDLGHAPRITYNFEWSPSMWKAAATHVLQLLLRLAKEGLTLRNPHPWYLVFDGPRPLYLNPGSIVPADTSTFERSWDKIERFFLRPLLLANAGSSHMARRLLHDVHRGVQLRDIPVGEPPFAWDPTTGESIYRFIGAVASDVERLEPREAAFRWMDYEIDMMFTNTSSWSKKEQLLVDVIDRFKIGNVLDLGANWGYYAKVAAISGCSVIGADSDESLVSRMWNTACRDVLPITPAVLDFTNPSPGYGVTNSWFPPASARLRSELVLCFALVHHLVFGRYRLSFSEVAKGLKSFSSLYALIEFCPAKRPVHEWRPDAAGWYVPENLAECLATEFGDAKLYEPADDGRQLLLSGPRGSLR